MRNKRLVLVVHNIRSAHNIGSILRSADGFGVDMVYLTGYSPYPSMAGDKRLPHVAKRAEAQIVKTSLGAEKFIKWQYKADVFELLKKLKADNFKVFALEQTDKSISLPKFKSDSDITLIVGSEIGGVQKDLLQLADEFLEIPMSGAKDSLNVSVATAVALYHLRYRS
ncbi:MAG TPA: TrmH family RNA methyltransferase [Candidatus Saccharimonadales bacterium]|nr:TrmH family RNA methyltransferase [Candidatus Saccharimonadales bacterium]